MAIRYDCQRYSHQMKGEDLSFLRSVWKISLPCLQQRPDLLNHHPTRKAPERHEDQDDDGKRLRPDRSARVPRLREAGVHRGTNRARRTRVPQEMLPVRAVQVPTDCFERRRVRRENFLQDALSRTIGTRRREVRESVSRECGSGGEGRKRQRVVRENERRREEEEEGQQQQQQNVREIDGGENERVVGKRCEQKWMRCL